MENCLTIDVSHGTTHDGPGMRTTVFVKGCPLRCRWCQNPESLEFKNAVWWDSTKCIGCMSCRNACQYGALQFHKTGISIDRSKCQRCGSCVENCPATAITWQGTNWTLEDLINEVLKDRHYYEQFGGGVTVSGGEPLGQYAFVAHFFEELHRHNINTALDTCGCAPSHALATVLPFADNVLFDIKILNSEIHKTFTGQPNEHILENLLAVANYKRNHNPEMRIWIRTPLIPGATATVDNISAIAHFISEHLADVVERWEMCAFNGACVSKYNHLGLEWPYAEEAAMHQSFIDKMRSAALSTGLPEHMIVNSGMVVPD